METDKAGIIACDGLFNTDMVEIILRRMTGEKILAAQVLTARKPPISAEQYKNIEEFNNNISFVVLSATENHWKSTKPCTCAENTSLSEYSNWEACLMAQSRLDVFVLISETNKSGRQNLYRKVH